MKFTPYGSQYIDKKDINSVKKVLKKDIITGGSEVIKFEKKIKNYLGCKYSAVCNSGTSALFLTFLAIKLKKNDIVIMPSINFIGAYNVAKILGARIFLADVDSQTGQMSPHDVEKCYKKFKLKKVKAIITMYNGGYPENASNFIKFKKKLGCYIIEDACHALGSEYYYNKKYYKIGSCKHSDLCTFSLHPLKTITTGEGGIVTTNSKKIDNLIKNFRSHGILKTKKEHWNYNVINSGFNFRLNEFQSALGISQLKKIQSFINYRKKIYHNYKKQFSSIKEISIPKYENNNKPSYHLYIINLKNFNLNKKIKFIKYILKKKIIVQYHYVPIYKFKVFKEKYIGINAEKYYENSVSLPIHCKLSINTQNFIIKKVKEFLKNNNMKKITIG